MEHLIEFSEEQGMLLETAMDFCGNHSPMSQVRARMDTDTGFDTQIWQEIVDLGWLGISIPEGYGGLDMGLADTVPIVEAMGRHLLASPFVATTVAAQALMHGGSEEQKALWLPKIAAGKVATTALTEPEGDWNLAKVEATGSTGGGKITLQGTKCFVLDAGVAEIIIVSVNIDGELRLVLVEASDIPDGQLVREAVIDETRRSFQVNLDGISVDVGNVLPVTPLSAIENAWLLMLCAEMAGGIAGVLNVLVEYLTTRKQFDRYIGSYQSLKHPTVDILLGLEGARSHLYHAATVFARGEPHEVEKALRMAKAQASEAFAFAGDRAIQFHGAFGFTWECDAQLYLRRAIWCQYQLGDERHQRQLVTPLLLDPDLESAGLAS